MTLPQVVNSRVLSDESTVNADEDNLLFIIPMIKNNNPTVTEDHIATFINLITQVGEAVANFTVIIGIDNLLRYAFL